MKNQFSFVLLAATLLFTAAACNNNAPASVPAADSTTATAPDTGFSVADNWKLGVQLWTFRMFTMEVALKKVDSCGVKNVEAFWGQPLGAGTKDSFGIRMSQAGRDKLKELLKSHNIQMVAMGVISPSTKEDWVSAFKLAKDFGLSYISAEPKKDMWDMVDSLAGVNGIKVAIHDHPRPNMYWSPDSVLAATKGHPNLGSCADVGHWARNGVNPVVALQKLEGHIFGVHLKDIKQFDKTDAADTTVGKGVIEFDPIFKELKRQHFKGMLSIEHESNWYHSVPDVIETVKFYNEEVSKLK